MEEGRKGSEDKGEEDEVAGEAERQGEGKVEEVKDKE